MDKIKRPPDLPSVTNRISTGCGNLYVTIGQDKGRVIEIIATLGKSGGCAKAQLEGLSRCISLGLKYGVPLSEYVDELKEIQCQNTTWDKDTQIRSCPDAMSKVLEEVSRIKEDGV